MIDTTIWWHDQAKEHCPDGIRILFYTFQDNWVFGTWDSDHDQYNDDNAQPIGKVLYWAYIPKVNIPYPMQIIATDEAAMKLYHM